MGIDTNEHRSAGGTARCGECLRLQQSHGKGQDARTRAPANSG
jgi:hypothetical protein